MLIFLICSYDAGEDKDFSPSLPCPDLAAGYSNFYRIGIGSPSSKAVKCKFDIFLLWQFTKFLSVPTECVFLNRV